MKVWTNRFTLLPALLCLLLLAVQPSSGETVAGWVERARIGPAGPTLLAKLDTGAEHSSLDARDLRQFQRHGADWVGFRVTGPQGSSFEFERRVIRTARIKRVGGASQQRPVVMLEICVGAVQREVEVNLVDRSGFDYPLLLGRSFLAGKLIVDAGRRERFAPSCPG